MSLRRQWEASPYLPDLWLWFSLFPRTFEWKSLAFIYKSGSELIMFDNDNKTEGLLSMKAVLSQLVLFSFKSMLQLPVQRESSFTKLARLQTHFAQRIFFLSLLKYTSLRAGLNAGWVRASVNVCWLLVGCVEVSGTGRPLFAFPAALKYSDSNSSNILSA